MIVKYNNKVVSNNGKWVNYTYADPYNPLNLPPFTIRLKYNIGVTPTFDKGTGTLVDATNNIWDLTYANTSWLLLFNGNNRDNLKEVLGANTSGVTDMGSMFGGCQFLTTVPLFDTSKVTRMSSMFYNCVSLRTVPLFDTSNVTNMAYMFGGCQFLTTVPLFDTSKATVVSHMFYNCTNVQSGALALYNQASTQAKPPAYHDDTFYNCGSDTETGAAELAQIPSDWK